MKFTRACDYAMRALLYIGEKPKGTVFLRSELAKQIEVPDSFLGKIMQILAKAEFLVSERGKKGGFKLAKPLEEISMYDVVMAVDGEIKITDCTADENFCSDAPECKVHAVWLDIQDSVVVKLKTATLKKLL
jgi:Rrf2 family protein